MTQLEQREIRGINVKNIAVTILSTVSIVASVMTTYFQLKEDIREVRSNQEIQARVNEIRIKLLEAQVQLLQQQVEQLTQKKYEKTNDIQHSSRSVAYYAWL